MPQRHLSYAANVYTQRQGIYPQYMIDEIVNQVKISCDEAEVDVPNIFTEFGSYTVGESGGAIYQILYQKRQYKL